MNFSDLLYGRTVALFGADATIAIGSDEPIAIRAIDRTAGIEIKDSQNDYKNSNIALMNVGPAADVRRKDLDEAGIELKDLDGAAFSINGSYWTIHTILELPTPFGASDGIVRLALVGSNG
jgi:hypothetical protein